MADHAAVTKFVEGTVVLKHSKLRFGLLLALPLAAGSPAAAQEEPPFIDGRPWRLLLEQQLSAEEGCDLMEVILADEIKKDGETILEGKIACVDGRKFDYLRRRTHQKFEFNLCEPAVC